MDPVWLNFKNIGVDIQELVLMEATAWLHGILHAKDLMPVDDFVSTLNPEP